MWTIIELITKNPEMSQHSSDLPMLVNFSIHIYFLEIFSELGGII